MIATILVALVSAGLILAGLAVVGFRALLRQFAENEKQGLLVNEFHADLVAYANSQGEDQAAFRRLTMNSAAVERALGWDNIVTGIHIGRYMMNRAPLLPLAVYEMRREYSEKYSFRDTGGEIADAVQTVLFRHLGRRVERGDRISAKARSFGGCIGEGWSAVAALPLSILSVFGILSAQRASRAKGTLIFRLWNLLLAGAAISGPILAYLADREAIEAAVRALIP